MSKKLKFPADRQPRFIKNDKGPVVCGGLHWKVNTPGMLKEISSGLKGASALKIPLLTFANLLALVAGRALELDDPKLNALMMDLALYEVDNEKTTG